VARWVSVPPPSLIMASMVASPSKKVWYIYRRIERKHVKSMDTQIKAKKSHTGLEGAPGHSSIPSNILHGTGIEFGDKHFADLLCTPPNESLAGMLRLMLGPAGTASKDSPSR
jgi:hypothetical protein